ncbi:MAG: tRNA 2-selenouridine(34) synthase MnmH [Rhodospirillaceae bacterium]|nr:tRNA 2-selenouridine(34) synthase MnmH [Rhodospirillaceae bacterium]|tara:strand:+ start:478 stop:1527 length:1050 start_codon:yes stop_codon:yes gene_type:complete
MSAPIKYVDVWDTRDYDLIIDVRSPSEFREDHIPEAISLPVLSDEERQIIGTRHNNLSPFEARKLGAAFVAQNISEHIQNTLEKMGRDFRPLVYCWRGGQRSKSFALVCSEIGWRTSILKGGYKTYRQSVITKTEKLVKDFSYIVVAGRTGNRKTDILLGLEEYGAQVLDLERLASHRGSLLGKLERIEQPSQKRFETLIMDKLRCFNPHKPVFLESESQKIGQRQIPIVLWKFIKNSPQITIKAPRHCRASYLSKKYKHLTRDKKGLEKLIEKIPGREDQNRTRHWHSLITNSLWKELSYDLLKFHYDPAYDKSLNNNNRKTIFEYNHEDISDAVLSRTVDDIFSKYR